MRRRWARSARDQAFYGGERKGRGAERFVFPDVDGEERALARRGMLLPPLRQGGGGTATGLAAFDAAPKGSKPLLIGDLTSDLDFPRDRQEEVLATDLVERGLRCVTRGFRTRRTRQMRGRWTWRQR